MSTFLEHILGTPYFGQSQGLGLKQGLVRAYRAQG